MIELANTQLLGHRGARYEALENSFSGFEHANQLKRHGLAGIEFDVQLTADGHLVVFHDDTLQRLCGLQSRIDQMSLVEIQRHLQLGHQIITLDQLAQALAIASPAKKMHTLKPSLVEPQKKRLNNSLALAEPRATKTSSNPLVKTVQPLTQFTHIELEIKTHSRTNHPKLVHALCRYLIDSPLARLPIVLTSFDVELLAQLQRNKLLAPMARGLLVRDAKLLNRAPHTALQLGCSSLGIHYLLLNKQVIDYCHRYDLRVSAWTVNDIAFAKQLVHWQVDTIITDIPSQLLI